MAVDELNVRLNLDAEEFADGLKSAVSLIKKLDGAIEDTDGGIRRNQNVIRAWANGVRSSLTEFNSLLDITSRIRTVVSDASTAFIRANADFEKTTAILSGLSTSAESTEQATAQLNQEIAKLEELTRSTPFNMQALQNSMVKLKAGGVEDLDFSMQALIDSVAKFGGGSQELDRASIAIQQMAGKGVVSMEELRQQLGEAVPNAMSLMARGLNVSMGELAGLVESGTLEATGALKAMFVAMSLENAGAAEDMTKTWDGTMSQISARMNQLLREMGDAGLFQELKTQAQAVLDILDDPATVDFFREVGAGLAEAIRETIEFIKYVDDLNVVMDILRNLLIGLAITKVTKNLSAMGVAIKKGVDGLDDMIIATKAVAAPLKNMRKELAMQKVIHQGTLEQWGYYNSAMIKAGNRTKQQKIVMAGLSATMANAGRLAATVGRKMLAMAGPIGIAASIVLELASAFDLFGDEVDKVREKALDATTTLNPDEYNSLALSVKDSRAELSKLNSELTKQQAIVDKEGTYSSKGQRAAIEVAEIKNSIALISKQIESDTATLKSQNSRLATQAARDFNDAFERELAGSRREVQLQYAQANKEIEELRKDPQGLTGNALKDQLEEMRLNADKQQAQRIATAKRNAAESAYLVKKSQIEQSNLEKDAASEQLTALKQTYDIRLAEISTEENKILNKIKEIRESGIGQLDKASDFWDKAYRNSFVELASWTAKLTGENANYAKSVAKASLAKQKDTEFTREQAEAIAKQVETVKRNIEVDKELAAMSDKVDKQFAKIAQSQKQVEQTNPWLEVSAAQKSYGKAAQEAQIWAKGIADEFGAQSDKAKEAALYVGQLQSIQQQQQGIDLTKMTRDMEDQTKQLQREIMTESELRSVREQSYKSAVADLDELRGKIDEISQKSGISKQALGQIFDDYGTALEANFRHKNMTAVESVLHDWSDTTTAMDNMWANTMTNLSSSLANFVTTGKLNFSSLADMILKSILQIQIQAAASNLFGNSGVFGGLFGGATGGAAAATAGTASIQQFAKGGIAKANSPQVAVFGEGSMNEAFVPLPDGRAIPVDMNGQSSAPNVSVNVINQTGTEASAEQGSMKFDGERWVLDVVMKAMNRPGSFRTAMKGSTRQ